MTTPLQAAHLIKESRHFTGDSEQALQLALDILRGKDEPAVPVTKNFSKTVTFVRGQTAALVYHDLDSRDVDVTFADEHGNRIFLPFSVEGKNCIVVSLPDNTTTRRIRTVIQA